MRRLLLPAMLLAACASDLKPTNNGNTDAGDPTVSEHFVVTADGDTVHVAVDATQENEWRYFDIETRRQVSPATPETSADWDIAFQRFRIKTNGGISGNGNAAVTHVFED